MLKKQLEGIICNEVAKDKNLKYVSKKYIKTEPAGGIANEIIDEKFYILKMLRKKLEGMIYNEVAKDKIKIIQKSSYNYREFFFWKKSIQTSYKDYRPTFLS